MFDTGMGRPIFWYITDLNAGLFNGIGLRSLTIFRGVGLALIAFASVLWFEWFLKWKVKLSEAYLYSVAIFLLPSYQIIVGNGCWLAPAILCAYYAGFKIYANCYKKKVVRLSTLMCCLLVIGCFATYQTIGFLSLLGCLVPMLWKKNAEKVTRRVGHTSCKVIGIIIGCFIIYYVSWRIALLLVPPSVGGEAYLPVQKNSLLVNVKEGVCLLLAKKDLNWPIGVIANMWRINCGFDLGTALMLCAAISGIGLSVSRMKRVAALMTTFLVFAIIGLQYFLFFILDNKYHMGRYTTIMGLTTGLAIAAMRFASSLFAKSNTIAPLLSFALLAYMSINAARYFLLYIIYPSCVENMHMKKEISYYDRRIHDGIIIKIGTSPLDQTKGVSREFIFNNQEKGYAWYNAKAYLHERGINEVVPIRVVGSDKTVLAEYNFTNTNGFTSKNFLIIDYSTQHGFVSGN